MIHTSSNTGNEAICEVWLSTRFLVVKAMFSTMYPGIELLHSELCLVGALSMVQSHYSCQLKHQKQTVCVCVCVRASASVHRIYQVPKEL